jgi:hypothetical protein
MSFEGVSEGPANSGCENIGLMSKVSVVGDGEVGGTEAVSLRSMVDNTSGSGDVGGSGVSKSPRVDEIAVGMLLVLEEAASTRGLRAFGRNLLKNREAEAFCVADPSSRTWAVLLTWLSQLASPPRPIFTSRVHVAQ